jgi:F-type H+-transporting ATPase subunit epsilon
MFQVVIVNSRFSSPQTNVLFEGHATSMILPGKDGEFEILDFHKPIISKLKKGVIVVDNEKEYAIRGGIAKMSKQNLIAIVDL